MHRIQELEDTNRAVRMEVDGLPFLPFYLNGQGPYLFAVDTGYLGFDLSQALVEDLALPVIDDAIAQVESLTVGNYRITDLRLTIRDNSRISELVKHQIGGMMGMGFLKYFEVVLDYPKSVMSLSFLDSLVGRVPEPQAQ